MIDVKLIRIVTGEEIIGEVLSETDDTITVQNGLVVLPSAQGVGFAPWATVISKEEPEIEMSKKHIVYVVAVQEDVSKKYNEMFGSKLITPDTKKLIV
jgi:membrane-anchored protein YejM (alkaline phosphatase superfamily)|tara:strand:- start:106 stop:399 length:294 start_codon:yes stop_codon:yes gene_type:complete